MPKETLLDLTCQLIDLQTEKKQYNKDLNERIKKLQESIREKAREDSTGAGTVNAR